jgi:hypothetical protein
MSLTLSRRRHNAPSHAARHIENAFRMTADKSCESILKTGLYGCRESTC